MLAILNYVLIVSCEYLFYFSRECKFLRAEFGSHPAVQTSKRRAAFKEILES